MKLNTIQKMMVDTGMLEIKLPVKHDTYEYPVVVNGVECDMCGMKEHPDLIRGVAELDICESCFDHHN